MLDSSPRQGRPPALARFVTITEGMLRQLFPAIFIARLVSLNLVQAAGPPTGG
jgi:hypothetical protein